MKTLFNLCLLSLMLTSCGEQTDNSKNRNLFQIKALSGNGNIELIKFKSVKKNNIDINFSNTQKIINDRSLKVLRKNNFHNYQQSILPLPQAKFVIQSTFTNEKVKLELSSKKELCLLTVSIKNENSEHEIRLYKEKLIRNEFYLELITNIEQHITLKDYKYCQDDQSEMERIKELKKENYFIHLFHNEKNILIPMSHKLKLINALRLIDPNTLVHENHELVKFLGKEHTFRMSPLNDHLDSDLFWFLIGINGQSTNIDLLPGKIINLTNFSMKSVRKTITSYKEEVFNGLDFSLAKYNNYRLKDLNFDFQIENITQKNLIHKSKCLLEMFGGGYLKCKVKEFAIDRTMQVFTGLSLSRAVSENNLHTLDNINFSFDIPDVELETGYVCYKNCEIATKFKSPYTGKKLKFNTRKKVITPKVITRLKFQIETMIL